MTINKNLKKLFDHHKNVISLEESKNPLEEDIYENILSKNVDNSFRRGIKPKIRKLNHINNFIKSYKEEKLNFDEEISQIEQIKDESRIDSNLNNKSINKYDNNIKLKEALSKEEIDDIIKKQFKKEDEIAAEKIRDDTINLDPNNENDNRKIKEVAKDLLFKSEGKRYVSYKDNNPERGRITIGIGFNMDDPGARTIWSRAFPENFDKKDNNIPDNIPDFNDAYNRLISLTEEQVFKLFECSFEEIYKIISDHYKEYWNKFIGNEQIAILNIAYNGPKIVTIWNGKETNFSKNMKKWVDTKDESYLCNAIYEVKYRSGSQYNVKLQNRKTIEAIILSTNKSPLFKKSTDFI
ncbi:hypothetical protein [Lyticum sinuosum]|uniref:Uncharacterized protein n=1 Tax=Lyticum sinuosum TaxID=1332059 RepID=A0AAE4VKJ8_9RICK|nr:hypothetical protein [Lyticum sinuosum]MDZ5761532.1 hypothetical protein [Lyticum sinuosum]